MEFYLKLPLFSYIILANSEDTGETGGCADFFEPSLFAQAIITLSSCAGHEDKTKCTTGRYAGGGGCAEV